MDSDGLGFWRTVWGNILAGVAVVAIVAAAPWVFGFHHKAWLVIAGVVGWLWGVLTYSVPVPVVVLLLFAGLGVYLWRSLVLQKQAVRELTEHQMHSSAATARTKAEPAPLSDNEGAIVRLLARADGKGVTAGELAQRAALAKLVAEQALDHLRARGFIKEVVSWEYARLYSLSPAGRDYAIDKGYVPQPLTAAARRALR